jgi:HEAT repeat protein
MMWPSRLRLVCAALVLLSLAGTGAGLWAFRGATPKPENAANNAGEGAKPAEEIRPPAREKLRYAGKSFDDWRSVLLTDLEPATRARALIAMGEFGANGYGREAVLAIVEAMRRCDLARNDQDALTVLEAGVRAVAKIGADALPIVVGELKKGKKNGRLFALQILAQRVFDDGAEAAIPAVVEALKDADPDVRKWAIGTLSSLDAGSRVTALADLVKDKNIGVRARALEALISLGPNARAATPKLLEAAIKDAADQCRIQALSALKAIGPDAKTILPTLREALKDKYILVRRDAISFLAELGPKAKEAVPDLVAALKKAVDKHERIRLVDALGSMGPAAKEALPALTEVISRAATRDQELRNRAMKALEQIGN